MNRRTPLLSEKDYKISKIVEESGDLPTRISDNIQDDKPEENNISEEDLIEVERGFEMLKYQHKKDNLRRRIVAENQIWPVFLTITKGLEQSEDLDNITESFSSPTVKRAIISLKELVNVFNKMLNFSIREEEFVGAGEDALSAMSDDQIDKMLETLEGDEEISEPVEVIEAEDVEDAEWEPNE